LIAYDRTARDLPSIPATDERFQSGDVLGMVGRSADAIRAVLEASGPAA